MDAVTAFQKKKQKEERKNQIDTYRKIEQDAIFRDQKIAEVNAKRLAEIKAGIEKQKMKQQRVREHQQRVASAENRKIDSELERYQKKIEKTKDLKQMFGDDRVAALARKNRSVDERVQ